MNDWDDLRYFNSLMETLSVRATAQALGVNPSTVTRRLDALEADLGIGLFVRSRQGLELTAEARAVRDQLQGLEAQVSGIETKLRGHDTHLAGRLRVALPDVFAESFVLREFAPFMERYPDIDLELVPGYQNRDLRRGVIDVAIRATHSPPEDMVGRPLARVALAAYAQADLVADANGPWVGPWIEWASSGEIMSLYRELREQYFAEAQVHLRCDLIYMHRTAVRAGMGAAILPCFMGEVDSQLARLPDMPVQSGPMLWLLTHPDLRRAARVSALMSHLVDIFSSHEEQLLGPRDFANDAESDG